MVALFYLISVSCSSDEPSEPPLKKARVAFTAEEEMELEEHFQLATRREMPSTEELQEFVDSCEHCKERTLQSIRNKVYYVLCKNVR